MSMIEVTKDLPRSADGLQMDWLEVPFGPVFPGLPGGLKLTLTLDGDGVTEGEATSLVGMATEGEESEGGEEREESEGSQESEEMNADTFIEHLSSAMPLAPVSYRLLACLAIEKAAGLSNDQATTEARNSAVERERIASHLGWLAQSGRQLGFVWLTQRASTLQLQVREANRDSLVALEPALRTLATRLERTPLLKSRLKGLGALPTGSSDLRGPVARAAEDGGDAWARLWQRLDEISASLELLKSGEDPELPVLRDIGNASGTGKATVDTPRGEARLSLTLAHGKVKSYELDTACSHHIDLVPKLVEGQELGDALLAVGSLDLSPWEVIP
jgi:Ni,Fe-hydrogenase III large subunit